MSNLVIVNLDELKAVMSEQAIPNEIWNSKKAASFLTISIPTLIKEAENGNIPGVKIGKDWKFSSIALYKYVAKIED